jgi:hypothetical protein
MAQLGKYFLITLLIQAVLVGFVFLTARVLGTAIGDGILFFLYVLPWIIVLPQGPAEPPSTAKLILATIGLAAVYSILISAALYLLRRRNRGANNYH